MAEKSSSSSSSGIDKALEGEPIITWTRAVLKECLRSQGGRLTGKKEYLVWRHWDRSLGDERLVYHLDWKFTPLGFYRAIFCHKNPEAATTLEKFCFWTLRGRRQDNEVGQQRSQGCTACTWPSHGAHFAHEHSVSSTLWETFFVVACPYQIKRNCLSSFWKKKTGMVVWMSNNIYMYVLL